MTYQLTQRDGQQPASLVTYLVLIYSRKCDLLAGWVRASKRRPVQRQKVNRCCSIASNQLASNDIWHSTTEASFISQTHYSCSKPWTLSIHRLITLIQLSSYLPKSSASSLSMSAPSAYSPSTTNLPPLNALLLYLFSWKIYISWSCAKLSTQCVHVTTLKVTLKVMFWKMSCDIYHNLATASTSITAYVSPRWST